MMAAAGGTAMIAVQGIGQTPPEKAPGTYTPVPCKAIDIRGWNTEWNRSLCAESVVTVKNTPHPAGNDAPNCIDGKDTATAVEVQGNLKQALGDLGSGAAAVIGTAYGGPVGAVAGAIFSVAGGAIIKNNTRFNRSYCQVACVQLPTDARNVVVQGWSAPFYNRQYHALCDFSTSNPYGSGRCDVPGKGNWAAMTPYTTASDPELGTTICTTAKNWSHTYSREMGLRVNYDRAGPKIKSSS